jgi:hypothetical protein
MLSEEELAAIRERVDSAITNTGDWIGMSATETGRLLAEIEQLRTRVAELDHVRRVLTEAYADLSQASTSRSEPDKQTAHLLADVVSQRNKLAAAVGALEPVVDAAKACVAEIKQSFPTDNAKKWLREDTLALVAAVDGLSTSERDGRETT